MKAFKHTANGFTNGYICLVATVVERPPGIREVLGLICRGRVIPKTIRIIVIHSIFNAPVQMNSIVTVSSVPVYDDRPGISPWCPSQAKRVYHTSGAGPSRHSPLRKRSSMKKKPSRRTQNY